MTIRLLGQPDIARKTGLSLIAETTTVHAQSLIHPEKIPFIGSPKTGPR